MVTGIRIEIIGEDVREALEHRIDRERERAEWWKYESERPIESQTIEAPVLPTHICLNEQRLAEWRAEMLEVIRERVKPSEVYLLNRRELDFLGFFPPKPTLIGPYDLEDEASDECTVERVDTASDGLEVIRVMQTEDMEQS